MQDSFSLAHKNFYSDGSHIIPSARTTTTTTTQECMSTCRQTEKRAEDRHVYTFGKLTVAIAPSAGTTITTGSGEILSSMARRFQMNPQEPASSYKEANECSAYEDSHQPEMVSRQRRCQTTKRSSCLNIQQMALSSSLYGKEMNSLLIKKRERDDDDPDRK